jgi:uncharacterized protein
VETAGRQSTAAKEGVFLVTIILYHGPSCPDGFGAAWLLDKYVHAHRIVGLQHTDPAPEFPDGEDVYMVDFVFDDVAKMEAIVERSKSLLILDHHQTAWGVVGQLEVMRSDNLAEGLGTRADGLRTAVINRDQTRSGMGLVEDYVQAMWPGGPLPWFTRYVQDRDLWKFEYPFTRPVMAAIMSQPYTIEVWDQINEDGPAHIVTQGEAIERFRQTLIDDAVRRAWRLNVGLWRDVWVTSCPYTIGSDAAGVLAQREPELFAAYLVLGADGVKVGLRSVDPVGQDVAEIAEQFGGGGHKHAAGFGLASDQAVLWLP